MELNKTEIMELMIESAKDFMYYGYTLKSFLEFDSFSHIDKDTLRCAWTKAKRDMIIN